MGPRSAGDEQEKYSLFLGMHFNIQFLDFKFYIRNNRKFCVPMPIAYSMFDFAKCERYCIESDVSALS